jgi:hypothetical protein
MEKKLTRIFLVIAVSSLFLLVPAYHSYPHLPGILISTDLNLENDDGLHLLPHFLTSSCTGPPPDEGRAHPVGPPILTLPEYETFLEEIHDHAIMFICRKTEVPLGTFQRVVQGLVMPLPAPLFHDNMTCDTYLEEGVVPHDEVRAVVECAMDTTRQLADHTVVAGNTHHQVAGLHRRPLHLSGIPHNVRTDINSVGGKDVVVGLHIHRLPVANDRMNVCHLLSGSVFTEDLQHAG